MRRSCRSQSSHRTPGWRRAGRSSHRALDGRLPPIRHPRLSARADAPADPPPSPQAWEQGLLAQVDGAPAWGLRTVALPVSTSPRRPKPAAAAAVTPIRASNRDLEALPQPLLEAHPTELGEPDPAPLKPDSRPARAPTGQSPPPIHSLSSSARTAGAKAPAPPGSRPSPIRCCRTASARGTPLPTVGPPHGPSPPSEPRCESALPHRATPRSGRGEPRSSRMTAGEGTLHISHRGRLRRVRSPSSATNGSSPWRRDRRTIRESTQSLDRPVPSLRHHPRQLGQSPPSAATAPCRTTTVIDRRERAGMVVSSSSGSRAGPRAEHPLAHPSVETQSGHPRARAGATHTRTRPLERPRSARPRPRRRPTAQRPKSGVRLYRRMSNRNRTASGASGQAQQPGQRPKAQDAEQLRGVVNTCGIVDGSTIRRGRELRTLNRCGTWSTRAGSSTGRRFAGVSRSVASTSRAWRPAAPSGMMDRPCRGRSALPHRVRSPQSPPAAFAASLLSAPRPLRPATAQASAAPGGGEGLECPPRRNGSSPYRLNVAGRAVIFLSALAFRIPRRKRGKGLRFPKRTQVLRESPQTRRTTRKHTARSGSPPGHPQKNGKNTLARVPEHDATSSTAAPRRRCGGEDPRRRAAESSG